MEICKGETGGHQVHRSQLLNDSLQPRGLDNGMRDTCYQCRIENNAGRKVARPARKALGYLHDDAHLGPKNFTMILTMARKKRRQRWPTVEESMDLSAFETNCSRILHNLRNLVIEHETRITLTGKREMLKRSKY